MNKRKSKALNAMADEVMRLHWKTLDEAVSIKRRQIGAEGYYQHRHINPRRIAKKMLRHLLSNGR